MGIEIQRRKNYDRITPGNYGNAISRPKRPAGVKIMQSIVIRRNVRTNRSYWMWLTPYAFKNSTNMGMLKLGAKIAARRQLT